MPVADEKAHGAHGFHDDHDDKTETMDKSSNIGVVIVVLIVVAHIVLIVPPSQVHLYVKFLSQMLRNSSEKSSISAANPFTRFVK